MSELIEINRSIDSLPLELWYQILLQLSYDDIVSYCRTSVRAGVICSDTGFWMQKLDYDYSHLSGNDMKPSDYVRWYEHLDRRGIDIYRRWENKMLFMNVDTMVRDGNNANAIWIMSMKRNAPYIRDIINVATKYGNMQILQWLDPYTPNIIALAEAAGNGHIQVLEWFEQRNIFSDTWAANAAASNGHILVLQWLEQRNILPSTLGANFTARHGRLCILYWLEQRNILPTTIGANEAAENGYLHVLRWLKTKGILPDIIGANWASR